MCSLLGRAGKTEVLKKCLRFLSSKNFFLVFFGFKVFKNIYIYFITYL